MAFFKGRSIVSIDDLTTDELRYIFSKSSAIKSSFMDGTKDRYRLPDDFLVSAIFLEDSTRTFHSFKSSASHLEGRWDDIPKSEGSSISKGETIYDTAMTLIGYGTDLLITRTKLEGVPRYLADNIGIPVFNAGDGKNEHPTQTILDLFTISEARNQAFDGTRIAMVGDLSHGRTVHSLAKGMCRFKDIEFTFVAPDFLQMPKKYLDIIEKSGNSYRLVESIDELLSSKSPEILYMTRLQIERYKDELEKVRKASKNLSIRETDLERIGDACIMHPMPRDKYRPVIPKLVDRTPNAWYWRQSQNGMFTRMAEILMTAGIIGDDFEGEQFTNDSRTEPFYTDKKPNGRKRTKKDYSIKPIMDGVVIDHIPEGKYDYAVRLIKKEFDISGTENYGGEFRSPSRGGFKGIYMVSGMPNLEDRELLRLAAIVPGATYNFVQDNKIISKKSLSLPHVVEKFESIQCINPDCITNPVILEIEPDENIFHKKDDMYECHYCGTIHKPEEIWK